MLLLNKPEKTISSANEILQYMKFHPSLVVCSRDIERKPFSSLSRDSNSVDDWRKMPRNNPKQEYYQYYMIEKVLSKSINLFS